MIGKITKQELHPSLLKYLKDIEESAENPAVYVSSEEPEDKYEGMIWYDTSEPGAYIWFEDEWHPLCSTTCGPIQPMPHDLSINLKQAEVVLSDIIEPGIIPLPFMYDPSKGFLQIIANGILLDNTMVKIEDGCLVKIDKEETVPKWNMSKNEKTRFLFTYIEQMSMIPNVFLQFHNKQIIVEKTRTHKGKIEVKIPHEILSSIENMHVLLNNVLLTEGLSKGQYIIEEDKIVGEWGTEGKAEDLHFTFLSIENNFSKSYPSSPKIEKETTKVEKGRAKLKMEISADDYLEVIANGIYVYPSEYTIFDNSIELNKEKWEEGTEVFVKKIGNTRVNVEKLPIKYLNKETIKNEYIDKKTRYIPIAPASFNGSRGPNKETYKIKQSKILNKIFEQTRPLEKYLNDPMEIIRLTSNDELTKNIAELYLNNPEVLKNKRNDFFIFNRLSLDNGRSIANLNLAKGTIDGIYPDNMIKVNYDNSYSFIPGTNLTVRVDGEEFIVKVKNVEIDYVELEKESIERLRETNFRGARIYSSSLEVEDNRFVKESINSQPQDKNTIRMTLAKPIDNSITLWLETGLETDIKDVYINDIKLEKYSTQSDDNQITYNFIQCFEKTQEAPTLRIEFESTNSDKDLENQIKTILGYIR